MIKPSNFDCVCGFCLWQISSAACGYGFTLIASRTKDVIKLWGMGLNKDSQLGFQRTQHSRRKNAFPLSKEEFSSAVIVSAQLVEMQTSGNICLSPTGDGCWCQTAVNNRVCAVRSYEYVLEPSPVALPLLEPQQTRVLQVSCGRAHSLVLTDNEGGKSSAAVERKCRFQIGKVGTRLSLSFQHGQQRVWPVWKSHR